MFDRAVHRISPVCRRLIPPRWRPIGYLTHLTQQRCRKQVASGPFDGMLYVDDSAGSAYIPKLLGTYERELHQIIERACHLRFSLVVNLGAGEGYYAVGLALRMPLASIVAFERDSRACRMIRELAHMNRVSDRVTVRGSCDAGTLAAVLPKREALIVCDTEGEEEVLLDPAKIPQLSSTSILVEMHDVFRPGLTDLIRARFSSTHVINEVRQLPRSRREYPFKSFGTVILPSRYLDWAVSEWRPGQMSWLWMTPRD